MPLADKIFFGVFALICMVGLWGNWIWIGKDGWSIPLKLRPGFFEFYLRYLPCWMLGLPTGMKHLEIQKNDTLAEQDDYSMKLWGIPSLGTRFALLMNQPQRKKRKLRRA